MQETPNYVKFLAIHVSPDGEIDENIEVISTQYEVIDTSKPSLRKHRKSILDDLKIFHDEAARKRLARGIMLIGSIFILLSGILLIVSLNMSKDIDEVVRNSNEFLRNKIHKSTPGPKLLIDVTDFNTTLS